MKRLLFGAVAFVAVFAAAIALLGAQSESAEATVNGISSNLIKQVAGSNITVTIDANEGDDAVTLNEADVTVVATAGGFTAGTCDPDISDAVVPLPCSASPAFTVAGISSTVLDEDIADVPVLPATATGGMDNIVLTFLCPTPGPAAAVITAIQGTSVKTLNLTCTGSVADIAFNTRMQTAAAVANVTTQDVSYIESTTATAVAAGSRAVAANLRTTATDSAGNKLGSVTVIYTTSDGSLVQTLDLATAKGFDTTAAVTGVANAVSIVHGTTGLTGDVATITANAASKTATGTVTFAGDAVKCVVTPASSTASSGGSTTITATYWSNAAETVPVPDYSTIAGAGAASGDPRITAVNAVGSGTFAVTGMTAPVAGVMTATLTVGATGGTGVLATMGGFPVTCNEAVSVSTVTPTPEATLTPEATATPPTTGGGTGDGAIEGTLPSSGFGLVTFGGSVDELKTALATSCASGAPIFATSGGAFVGYFPTASIVAVNAAFNALYSGGIPASTPLIGGNC